MKIKDEVEIEASSIDVDHTYVNSCNWNSKRMLLTPLLMNRLL